MGKEGFISSFPFFCFNVLFILKYLEVMRLTHNFAVTSNKYNFSDEQL